MRAFIILGFLVAASTAGNLGYNYVSPTAIPLVQVSPSPIPLIKTTNLEGSGSSLVGTIGTGGLGGSRLISTGGGLIGTGNSGLITTGGLGGSRLISTGSGLIGNSGLITTGGLGGSRLISTGGGLIGTGNSGVITTGGLGLNGIRYGNPLIGTGIGLVGNRGLISSGGYGGGIIGAGGLINGGSQIITGGSRLIGGGATNLVEIPSLDSIPQTVEYSKQFFHYEAPEELQEEGTVTKQLSNVLKKNLQVVFIKAPENNGATNAALQLAKQAIEQKTDIYVLSKQNDGAQLVGQLEQIQENVPTVPDVRIVKYRTPQDLAYAKEIIQAQYENTGGSSQSFDGGIAPVLNYASGVSSLSGGGAILGTGLGSTNIVGTSGTVLGSSLGSGLGSTNIISSGPVLGSTNIVGTSGTVLGSSLGSGLGSANIISSGPVLGSGLGTTTTYVNNGPLLGSGIGSTKIIGTSPLLGSGVTTTKIINGGSLIGSGAGSYGLGSNQVSSVSLPATSQYLPPLKKK